MDSISIHCVLLSGTVISEVTTGSTTVGMLLHKLAKPLECSPWNLVLLDEETEQKWSVEDAHTPLTLTDGHVFRAFVIENPPFECFIRYPQDIWQRGKHHHEMALDQFLIQRMVDGSYEGDVCVPHEDGGNFKATFLPEEGLVHSEKDRYMHRWSYQDEYGRVVEIMMGDPGFVGFINRITS
jgi:hypothetical protein